MNAFKSGDKVTHPLTGDAVLTVLHSGVGRAGVFDPETQRTMTDYTSEFTPYTPPRVSTAVLSEQIWAAIGQWRTLGDLGTLAALIDAATAYRDRLEEEQQ